MLTSCTVTDHVWHSKGYFIRSCGDSSAEVSNILDRIRGQITKALAYIDNAIKEKEDATIYNAFLGGVDPNVVSGVLNRTLVAAKIFSTEHSQWSPPTIICVNLDKAQPPTSVSDKAERCDGASAPASYVAAVGAITLCPPFSNKVVEATHTDCAKRSRSGKRLTNSIIAGSTQTAIILHGLVRIYMKTRALEPEVREINQAIALAPQDKTMNSLSYVYFVESECSPPISLQMPVY